MTDADKLEEGEGYDVYLRRMEDIHIDAVPFRYYLHRYPLGAPDSQAILFLRVWDIGREDFVRTENNPTLFLDALRYLLHHTAVPWEDLTVATHWEMTYLWNKGMVDIRDAVEEFYGEQWGGVIYRPVLEALPA